MAPIIQPQSGIGTIMRSNRGSEAIYSKKVKDPSVDPPRNAKYVKHIVYALLLVICLLCYTQGHSSAADKPRKGAQNTKQPAQIQQTKPLIDSNYEVASNIKRIDFSVYKSNYSIAPGEFIKVNYSSGCGYWHHSIFKFHVYRLKDDHTSYAIRLTGQVDKEACMKSNMVNINYEIKDNFIHIMETNENLNITSIHPRISIMPMNSLLTNKDGKLFLLYQASVCYKMDRSGDKWNRVGQDAKAYAIDPENANILYIITKNNSVQKSMDGGAKWLTINNGLPSNSNFFDIVINPHNPQEVFVLTTSGLFKTSDAGFSWGQTSLRDIVLQLLIHPQNKSIYFARTLSTPVISKDAGATWTKIDDALPKRIVKGKGRAAEKLPTRLDSIAYVNFKKPFLMAITAENGILKTEDNGVTWREMNNGFNVDDGAYSIYADKSNIYIGSYGCIYQFKNGSDKWVKINLEKESDKSVAGIIGIYPIEEGSNGFIIADNSDRISYVDKDNNVVGLNYGVMPHSNILALTKVPGQNKLYANVSNTNYTDRDRYGLYYSTDNGKTWRESLVYSYTYWGRPRLFLAPKSDEMWLLDDEGVYTSSNCGQNWRELPNSIFKIGYSRYYGFCFAFDPVEPNIKYVCNHEQLFRFDNRTGNRIELKLDKPRHSLIIAHDDPKKLLAGFNLSTDGGWTWKDISAGITAVDNYLTKSNIDVWNGSIVPVHFDSAEIIIFVSIKNARFLLSSRDSGNSWQALRKITTPKCYVWINPSNHDHLFWGYQEKEKETIQLTESLDRGRTWKPFCIYTPSGKDVFDVGPSIAFITEDGKKAIYIGTKDGLYKTSDGGITWKPVGGISDDTRVDSLRVTAPQKIQ